MTQYMSGSIFNDEAAARAWFEAARWPYGPVCPHCSWTKHYRKKKPGVYRCADITCMKDFTVKTRTVMARSPVKLTQWATAFHLGAASECTFSARALQRELGCHPKTASSMFYGVSEAMRRGSFEMPAVNGEGASTRTVSHGRLDLRALHAKDSFDLLKAVNGRIAASSKTARMGPPSSVT